MTRISVATKRFARAVAYYENGVKRIDGDWAGTGVAVRAFLIPIIRSRPTFHPRRRIVFERLCTADALRRGAARFLAAPSR